LNKKFGGIKEAFTAVFPPPPVMGLGTLGGFKMQIEDRDALGYAELDKAAQAFMKAAAKEPALGPMFSSYQINVPQLDVELDRVKAK
ncbi:efflux RND transporter permease subunit, partial [Salmonella enterica]